MRQKIVVGMICAENKSTDDVDVSWKKRTLNGGPAEERVWASILRESGAEFGRPYAHQLAIEISHDRRILGGL